MNEVTKTIKRKRLSGTVVSDKMNKTVVVRVDSTKVHPIYRKRFVVSKRYKVHDPENQYKVGDEVMIEETRPISKDKCWRVVEKLNAEEK